MTLCCYIMAWLILFSWQWVKLFRHATPTKCAHWIAFTPPFSDEALPKQKIRSISQNSTFMKYQNHGPWCYSGSCTWHHDGLTQQEFPTLHRWTLPSFGPPWPCPARPACNRIWWPTALPWQCWIRRSSGRGPWNFWVNCRGVGSKRRVLRSTRPWLVASLALRWGLLGPVEVRWRQGWR